MKTDRECQDQTKRERILQKASDKQGEGTSQKIYDGDASNDGPARSETTDRERP